MGRYRVRTKVFFLTFSRSPHPELRKFYDQCKTKDERLVRGVGVLETHDDGGPHWHFALEYSDVVDIGDPRYFDFEGRHPKIESCRSWRKTVRYFKKEKNPEFFGETKTENQEREAEAPDLAMHAKEAGTKTVFYQWAFANKVPYPYAYYMWESTRGNGPIVYNEGDIIKGSIPLPELQFRLFDIDEPRSLVIVGPPGCGKTTWAKRNAPKPALFITHIDDLKRIQGDTKTLIFDDMDFTHLPRPTQIYLTDRENQRSIHCRYGNATVPEGIHRIFTNNFFPFIDDPAINRRIYRIDLY